MVKAYVDGCVNWLFPAKVNFSAIPNAFTAMIETDPTVEQIDIYISGFFFPGCGATL